MCLRIDLGKTAVPGDKQTFYKVLNVRLHKDAISFYTPYRYVDIDGPGIQSVSTFYNQELVWGNVIEDGALHLYTSLSRAEGALHGICRVTFPVIVNKEDIIAFGDDHDVAVQQYEITKDEWDKAVVYVKNQFYNYLSTKKCPVMAVFQKGLGSCV